MHTQKHFKLKGGVKPQWKRAESMEMKVGNHE